MRIEPRGPYPRVHSAQRIGQASAGGGKCGALASAPPCPPISPITPSRPPTGRASSTTSAKGQDATPIWIPQLAMSVGAVLLAICFWDNLVPPDPDSARTPSSPPCNRARGRRSSSPWNNSPPSLFSFLYLFALLGSGVWVGLGPARRGLCRHGTVHVPSAPGDAMITTIWTASSSWTLTALPLFIWMGEILYRTRLSEDMFRGLSPWMARPARRSGPYQYCGLHRLCRRVRLLGGDADHRRQNVHPRAAQSAITPKAW